MSDEMVTEKTWEEFRATGLFLIINQFLHIFGWAIVLGVNMKTGQVEDCYPARIKFRGFDEKSTSTAYKQISTYMKENAEQLEKEAQK
jgi:hypothetical protein